MKLFLGLSLSMLLAACSTMSGPNYVKYSIGNQRAVINVGYVPLTTGDRVGLYSETCKDKRGNGFMKDSVQQVCERKKVTEGLVVEMQPVYREAIISTAADVDVKDLVVIKE